MKTELNVSTYEAKWEAPNGTVKTGTKSRCLKVSCSHINKQNNSRDGS